MKIKITESQFDKLTNNLIKEGNDLSGLMYKQPGFFSGLKQGLTGSEKSNAKGVYPALSALKSYGINQNYEFLNDFQNNKVVTVRFLDVFKLGNKNYNKNTEFRFLVKKFKTIVKLLDSTTNGEFKIVEISDEFYGIDSNNQYIEFEIIKSKSPGYTGTNSI